MSSSDIPIPQEIDEALTKYIKNSENILMLEKVIFFFTEVSDLYADILNTDKIIYILKKVAEANLFFPFLCTHHKFEEDHVGPVKFGDDPQMSFLFCACYFNIWTKLPTICEKILDRQSFEKFIDIFLIANIKSCDMEQNLIANCLEYQQYKTAICILRFAIDRRDNLPILKTLLKTKFSLNYFFDILIFINKESNFMREDFKQIVETILEYERYKTHTDYSAWLAENSEEYTKSVVKGKTIYPVPEDYDLSSSDYELSSSDYESDI